jgi:hypothetical protein
MKLHSRCERLEVVKAVRKKKKKKKKMMMMMMMIGL